MEVQKYCNQTVSDQPNTQSKKQSKIKFNIDTRCLKCFMSEHKTHQKLQHQSDCQAAIVDTLQPNSRLSFSLKPKPNGASLTNEMNSNSVFNHKLLIIQYDDDEFMGMKKQGLIGKPKLDFPCTTRCEINPDNQNNATENLDENIVAECLRVITEETDNTSNPSKDSLPLYHQNYQNFYSYYPYSYYNQISDSFAKTEPLTKSRAKKSGSYNDNQVFRIQLASIEKDGRTTLMLRNIPNKYTRDMILEEINSYEDFKKKYDFFYLPIDYRNQCNVGYAFINLIHTKFIKEFYERFHLKKWQKFNSEKICHICYARIQGTAQLLSHFKDSNVLQQKDKRIRPLIDFKNESLNEIVERQRKQTKKSF